MKTMKRFPGYRNKGVESLLYHSRHCEGRVLSAGKTGAGKGKFFFFTWSPGRRPQVSPANPIPHHHWQTMTFVFWKTVAASPRKRKSGWRRCGAKPHEARGPAELRGALPVPVPVPEAAVWDQSTEVERAKELAWRNRDNTAFKGFCLP